MLKSSRPQTASKVNGFNSRPNSALSQLLSSAGTEESHPSFSFRRMQIHQKHFNSNASTHSNFSEISVQYVKSATKMKLDTEDLVSKMYGSQVKRLDASNSSPLTGSSNSNTESAIRKQYSRKSINKKMDTKKTFTKKLHISDVSSKVDLKLGLVESEQFDKLKCKEQNATEDYQSECDLKSTITTEKLFLNSRNIDGDLRYEIPPAVLKGTDIQDYVSFNMVRSPEERSLNPDKLNLNSKALTKCLQLYGEEYLSLLNYQNNSIKKIQYLENLRNLVFLDFFNNDIDKIVGLGSLGELKVLMLGKNKIKKIENLDSNTKLEVLDLHGNEIIEILNVNHLNRLKVLNLENNKIKNIPKLFGLAALTELNLRSNEIQVVHNLNNLHSLRHLILSDCKISSFDCLTDLFNNATVHEISMDGNTVANEELYRPIMITFVRPLKILDRKRILEEERRNFIKVIKREEEKRKEQEKQIIQSEKKCKAVAKIKNNWNLHKTTTIFSGTEKDNIEINCIDVEKDGFKKSGNWTKKTGFYTENTGDTAVENKDTYVDVNGGVLSIFGPGLGVLEKVMNNIEIIEFNYIEFEEIEQHLAKISKNYPALQAMRFTSNNLNHLYQLESLKVLKLNELSFSDEGNSIVSLGIFRKYLIYIFKNLPLEILNGIQIETCERIEAEKFFAGIKKIQNQQYQLFSTLNSFVSQTLDTMGNPSSIQDDASNIKKNLKPAHSLKSESKAYVKALIKERIEFNTKIKIFDEFWTNLVKEMCK